MLQPPIALHHALIATVVGFCFSFRIKQVKTSDVVDGLYRDRMTALQHLCLRI